MIIIPQGIAVAIILTIWSQGTVSARLCLETEEIPEQKFFYHNNEQQKVTVLVNHRVSTRYGVLSIDCVFNGLLRLVGSVFKIFAQEMLGYDVETVLSDDIETDTDTKTTFSKLSSCKNEL